MIISVKFSWKALWRSVLQSAVMIPVGMLTSLVGWSVADWQTWAVFIVLITVSNQSFHNEQMEKYK